MTHKTDVSLIAGVGQTVLALWEAGEDICNGYGDVPDFRMYDQIGESKKTYPAVSESVFKDFAQYVSETIPDGETEQHVSFVSVGYNKHGVRLRATISAKKPMGKTCGPIHF